MLNPDIDRNGTAMGTASVSNNSRVLTETAASVAAFGDNIQPPAGPTELTKGVAKTGLSAGTGDQAFFTFDVPSSATTVTFTMSGGSGDADLYTKFGSAPNTSSYDCRPYVGGAAYTDNLNTKGTGSYTYQVCDAGTSVCSASQNVVF